MPPADALEQLLRRQTAALQLFRNLLVREHSALVARDIESINACFIEHAQAVSTLEALEYQLQPLRQQTGLKKLLPNIDAQLAAFPAPQRSRLKILWDELLALAAECRDRNAVNSTLVNAQRKNTESALRILKGQEASASALYAPDGKISNTSPLSSIATV